MTKKQNYKGRVLFLHGFTQSALVFYAKTLALRKRLQLLGYKAIYLNGPRKLTPALLPTTDALSKFNSVAAAPDEETNYRAWWIMDANGTFKVDDAIATVKQYVEENVIAEGTPDDAKANDLDELDKDLPIVGLVGFSQGAAFTGALVHTFEELFGVSTLEFAILYSGFRLDTRKMPEHAKYYTSDDGALTKARLLHVVGELDTVVGDDRAYTFYDITKKNLHMLKHPGGHFVPNSRMMVDQAANWILAGAQEEKEPEKDDVDDLLAMMDKIGG